jgi:hypothetical protein
MLIKCRVLTLLVRRGDEFVALLLDPFPQAEFILRSAEELGFLFGVFTTLRLINSHSSFRLFFLDDQRTTGVRTHIIQDQKNLALLARRRS